MWSNSSSNEGLGLEAQRDPLETEDECEVVMKDSEEHNIVVEQVHAVKLNRNLTVTNSDGSEAPSKSLGYHKSMSISKRKSGMALALRHPKSKWNPFRTEYLNLNGGSGTEKTRCLKQTTLEFKEAVEVKTLNAEIDDDVWELLVKASSWKFRRSDDGDQISLKWIQEHSAVIPDDSAIPILLVAVQEGIFKGNSLMLMDRTGIIGATVDDAVISNYRSMLVPGTCLAIRRCSILNDGKSNIKLSIANHNVVFLASKKEFTKDDLPMPSWSDYVFFKKRNDAGIALLQLDTINYEEVWNEEREFLKCVTTNAEVKGGDKEQSDGIDLKSIDKVSDFSVFDDDYDDFLRDVAAQFD